MQIAEIRDYKNSKAHQPDQTSLIGYAALIKHFDLAAPYPDPIAVVSDKRIRPDAGSRYASKDGFAVYESNYKIEQNVGAHLLFALKHEELDLMKLKKIFEVIPPRALEEFITDSPASASRRQIWFLYEYLLDKKLNLPNTDVGNYVDAIDSDVWHTASAINSPRHRVKDNLPGSRSFCPLIKREASFDEPLAELVDKSISNATKNMPAGAVTRLSNRLLIKDSKSSFMIESENPSNIELQRWSNIIKNAGSEPLTVDFLEKLQKELMKDKRFVIPGIRKNGVFLGDHVDGYPIPSWIGAKAEDVRPLMEGLLQANERMQQSGIDPIAQAAAIAFGMVYIHPFEDGNGRLHRYVMQHVLNSRGVTQQGIVLPVANSILEDMDGYASIFNNYNAPRMPLIKWQATKSGNVEVLNDTKDIYSFYDATESALYLKKRVQNILDHTIPQEIKEMCKRDRVIQNSREIFDMPTQRVDQFMHIVLQNGGILSKGKRSKMYPTLTDQEVSSFEELVQDTFDIEPNKPPKV